jgi:hypothetical protein
MNFQEKQKILEAMIQQNSNVDVVFMLDCTGSMYSHINETQSQVKI